MTVLIFMLTTLLSLLFFYLGTGKDKRPAFIFIVWQLIIGGLAVLEVFERKPVIFVFAILGTILLTFLSLRMVEMKKVNIRFLLCIHVLRIPVELILYRLYLQYKIPGLMTLRGWNFDILMGFSALILLMYIALTGSVNKLFFTIWNIAGMFFLLIIVSLAILSSPLPIQQLAFEQPNVAILEFPYCFLPTCVVPIVLLSHILLITGQTRK